MAWVSCSFVAWSHSECVATLPPLVQVTFSSQDDHSCPEKRCPAHSSHRTWYPLLY